MPDGKGIVMRLKTDRLIIDHFTGSDVSMWAEIEADPDVRRFSNWSRKPMASVRVYTEYTKCVC